MRRQQRVWFKEHQHTTALPTMANSDPTAGIVYFANYLNKVGIGNGKAVDIGSGKGRNSIFLAQLGFKVYCLEYIASANEYAKALAEKNDVSARVHFYEASIDRQWKFNDGLFDVAIDSYASIDIETKRGREMYRHEMFRTLKPGGHAAVLVVSSDDEWERKMIDENPGPEPNSCIWPENGKFQKDYDEAELREFYKSFDILEIKRVTKPVFKLNRHGFSTDLWAILRKT